MADNAHQHANSSGADDSPRLAATQLFDEGQSLSRQETDIALAAELLECGILSEREIAASVSDWSIHGNISLAEHIADRGLLAVDQIETLQQRAASFVDRARQSAAGDTSAPTAGQSLLVATLERLDGSGRVAKLLGVAVAASGGEEEQRVLKGRYELIRKLGQGGLGRVWLARDLNLNRHVALKEISHQSGASEAVIYRFKHEAEITSRLEHPGIVPIYQLGDDESTSRVFYTMRFLGKATLQDSIAEYHERRAEGDEDPMLLRHLLTAFVNICHALGHAHSRKVIHRDLKPENVVIDNFGQVIVIDWGLAKVTNDDSIESLTDSVVGGSGNRTSEGQVLGTPLYMAPEQAAGRLDEVDHRTDIYGLGAILFAIITGYAPHEKTQRAAVDSGAGARGMISSIASGVTPSASEVYPSVDPALESICAKSMARRRYARYQQATYLANDVQRWMAGEAVTAYEETTLQRVGRWVSRHQKLSQALAALAMVILVTVTTLAMAARHSYVANLNSRFAHMEGDVREIELQLRGVARELATDARFIASLPPIQGIVRARAGVEDDTEDVWRTRLETIYTGMLRSKSKYLALSYIEMSEKGGKEIVRGERNPADPSLVRVLPISRLHHSDTDMLMADISLLEQGDVKMSLDARPRYAQNSTVIERLSVATPVYSDISGSCFGMALIEADISGRIKEVLIGLGGVECEIFVADGLGNLWVRADPWEGVQMAAPGQTIPDLAPQVVSRLADRGVSFELRQGNKYIAKRFYVDPTGRGVLLFARLPAEE